MRSHRPFLRPRASFKLNTDRPHLLPGSPTGHLLSLQLSPHYSDVCVHEGTGRDGELRGLWRSRKEVPSAAASQRQEAGGTGRGPKCRVRGQGVATAPSAVVSGRANAPS